MTPEPLSGASISSHAAEEAARRQIPEGRIREALESPGQVLPVRTGRVVVHLRYHEGTREYLLRAFVDIDRESPVVVPVYRTSKIAKYWSSP